jgi:hypothetical protein
LKEGIFPVKKRIINKQTECRNVILLSSGCSIILGCYKFKDFYYPNISQAIKNAESFSGDFPDLFDNLGSNLPKLLGILGFQA